MTTLDVLLITLAVCSTVLTVGAVFLTKRLLETLNILNKVLASVEDTTADVRELKNSIKIGGLSALSKLLGLVGGKIKT